LCRPICEGGFGFDYRSAANVSALWQKVGEQVRLTVIASLRYIACKTYGNSKKNTN